MSERDTWGGVAFGDVIQASHEAFVVMDDAGLVLAWNEAAERMFGYDAGAAVGARLSELIIPERYRDLHERGLRRYLETGVGPVLGTTIEIEGVDRDGRAVPVELTINATSHDGGARFHAFLNDITDRRRTERFLRADARLGWTCADRGSPLRPEDVLAAIGEEMMFEVGLAWLADPGGRLRLAGQWTPSDAAVAFSVESAEFSFERGEGIPGQVWERGEPSWQRDVSEEPGYVRRANAQRLGLRCGLFVPVGRGSACRGVLELLTSEWQPADRDLLERFARLGDRLGSYVASR